MLELWPRTFLRFFIVDNTILFVVVDVVVVTFSETVEVSTVSNSLCALSSELLVSLEFLEGFLTFFVTSLNFVTRAVIPIFGLLCLKLLMNRLLKVRFVHLVVNYWCR